MSLEGLRGLPHLKQLDVRWNQLTKAREDTAVLRKHTPTLLKLDSRYNPWKRVCVATQSHQKRRKRHRESSSDSAVVFSSQPKAVRMTMLSRLTTLTHLDDVVITEEEAARAAQVAAGSKINQVRILQNESV